MVLGNEHVTRPERAHLPNQNTIADAGQNRDDRVVAVSHRPASAAPLRLRADDRDLLRALVNHLLPVDDGATIQADIVVRYIDWLVADESAGIEYPLTLSDVYTSGCELVQAHACRVYDCRVQAMTAAELDQLVWDMLESSMDGFERFSPAYFFHTLRRHIADAMQTGVIAPN